MKVENNTVEGLYLPSTLCHLWCHQITIMLSLLTVV